MLEGAENTNQQPSHCIKTKKMGRLKITDIKKNNLVFVKPACSEQDIIIIASVRCMCFVCACCVNVCFLPDLSGP